MPSAQTHVVKNVYLVLTWGSQMCWSLRMFSGSGPREFWNSGKNSLFLRPNEDIVLLWGPRVLLFLSNLLAQIYAFVKVGHSRKSTSVSRLGRVISLFFFHSFLLLLLWLYLETAVLLGWFMCTVSCLNARFEEVKSNWICLKYWCPLDGS